MFVEGIVSPPRSVGDVDRFEAEIQTATRAGARVVRTVIIPGRRYEQFHSLDEFREFDERGRRSLRLAEPIVRRHRVRLAVENHKDHRLAERVKMLRQLDSEYIGACLDMGNNLALLEDPVTVAEGLAPWAFSVHLKDQAVKPYAHGFLLADIVLGQGCIDLPKIVQVIRKARPEVRFSLETITRDPLKIPCLTKEYWATFPDVPARDLARTLRLVRRQSTEHLPQVSALSLDDQVAMEEETVRGCIEYARTRLGLVA
jgi:sugar phosphate isomerase/epimerase